VCRKEVPFLEKEVWQPLKNQGLMVVGVNFKEKKEIASQAANEMGMTYPVALDGDGKIFEKFARGGVTRNVVLDEKLNIIFLTRLFNIDEINEMKAVIQKHLDYDLKRKPGEEMVQTKLQNLSNEPRDIILEYSGKFKIHVEGKIFSIKKKEMEIGVALFNDDIVSSHYDKETKSFRIGYRHYDGIRIAILPMTKFTVPLDIEKVIISDIE